MMLHVRLTSYCCWCDDFTSHPRQYDVISTSCADREVLSNSVCHTDHIWLVWMSSSTSCLPKQNIAIVLLHNNKGTSAEASVVSLIYAQIKCTLLHKPCFKGRYVINHATWCDVCLWIIEMPFIYRFWII